MGRVLFVVASVLLRGVVVRCYEEPVGLQLIEIAHISQKDVGIGISG